MITCLACSNPIPEGFGICLDCETLLGKALLVVEVFTALQQRPRPGCLSSVGSVASRGTADLKPPS